MGMLQMGAKSTGGRRVSEDPAGTGLAHLLLGMLLAKNGLQLGDTDSNW